MDICDIIDDIKLEGSYRNEMSTSLLPDIDDETRLSDLDKSIKNVLLTQNDHIEVSNFINQ